ncbi:hypothetical protein K435DRAFT_848659 [Dendrothele bispora CBS 962.96]|uniref:Nephrocystin 3-like N-terminal domain-containing protein n=1 Tax=Dendrothele bispora (strain CBS 962.96) TaxID=1314807 RepID=A0A4S8MUS0_DENBC|nr:hypothetical protein K435DRAFT_848659 [Dendrothele bispora CBS 962.96]
MASQSPLPSSMPQELLTPAKSSRTNPLQDSRRMSRRLIDSMKRVFSKQNTVPVIEELWGVFRNASALIPVPGIQAVVGMIDEIKTQMDMENSADIRDLKSKLEQFKQLVEAKGYQNETGAELLIEMDEYGPNQLVMFFLVDQRSHLVSSEAISVYFKKFLKTLDINVQELDDKLKRRAKIMAIIDSKSYAKKIEEIVTHMNDMFTYIQMQAVLRADVERENTIKRRLIDAIPHVQVASDDKVVRAPPYEGTYVSIIQCIVDWRDNAAAPAIFWLYGPLSSGKTTVLVGAFQKLSQDLIAEFRCTRVIPSYNDVHMIIPTLAWKLQDVNAPYRRQLASRLDRLPEDERTTDAIQKWGLKQQLKELFIEPFASIPQGQRGSRKVILAIDSLEECLHGAHSAVGETNSVKLLEAITEMNDSSQRIKFIIISRDINGRHVDHGHIKKFLDDPKVADSYHMAEYRSSEEGYTEMSGFYEKELGPLVKLSRGDLRELASNFQGRFVLAKAVCDAIQGSLDPGKKLRDVIDNKEYKEITGYYQDVLNQATMPRDPKQN